MRSDWIIQLITLLLAVLVPLDAFAATTTKKSSYLQTVTDWLDEEKIPWQLQDDAKTMLFPRKMTSQPVVEVRSSNNDALYYLHILKSPSAMSDCVSPSCTRDMVNYVQFMNNDNVNARTSRQEQTNPKISLIHLHEDVWHSKTEIVQSRLRIRLGHSSSRIYARKTMARRIDAGTAIPFLQEHHLRSATKARYHYGLFLPSKHNDDQEQKEEVLVAVATFSSKRKILRGSRDTRSHELIRFCTRANSTVVGGITKLIRAFVNDQKQPVDDILAVVDRDWGPSNGLHSIGFETLHVMAPLVMVVKDGIRRHLVGAGITNDIQAGLKTNKQSTGRLGFESHVLEELADLTTHQEALQCLEKHEYYPVYGAGVERLLMVVAKEQSGDNSLESLVVPSTYAPTLHSTNRGISVLMSHVVAQTASLMYGRPLSATLPSIIPNTDDKAKLNDSIAAQEDTTAWQATRGTARNATLVYTTPSSLDPHASVEVRERPGGWCTLGIVVGRAEKKTDRSIYHGIFKLGKGGDIDSSVLVSEYLRTMAAVALSALEFRQSQPSDDPEIVDDNRKKAALSFLHLGYGAGSLPRFMANIIPGSHHVAIELDDGVVRAAHNGNLLSQAVKLQLGDALTYQPQHNDFFDAIFVDIFDSDNLLPKEFYSKAFLERMYETYLGAHPDGIVIHNFHTGGKARGAQLKDAIKGYRSVFSTTLAVESVGSYHTGGNTILLATNKIRLDASSETLSWYVAGRKAQERCGINFDILARTTNKLWLS